MSTFLSANRTATVPAEGTTARGECHRARFRTRAAPHRLATGNAGHEVVGGLFEGIDMFGWIAFVDRRPRISGRNSRGPGRRERDEAAAQGAEPVLEDLRDQGTVARGRKLRRIGGGPAIAIQTRDRGP